MAEALTYDPPALPPYACPPTVSVSRYAFVIETVKNEPFVILAFMTEQFVTIAVSRLAFVEEIFVTQALTDDRFCT